MFHKKFERLGVAISVVALIAALLAIVLLPLLDLLDWEIPYLNPKFLETYQLFDFPENNQEVFDIRSRVGVGVVVLTLSSLVVYLAVLVYRKSLRVSAVARQFRRFSEMYSDYFLQNTQRLNALRNQFSDGQGLSQDALDKIYVANEAFFKEVCNMITSISMAYFGIQCAVSIKSYARHSGAIITYARDGKSHDQRKEKVDDRYQNKIRSYSYNSVFHDLIIKNESEFFNNDLSKLERKGEYQNEVHPNREDDYNRCLVVPISRAEKGGRDILGFICIDSRSAKFGKGYFLHIIHIIANLLYSYFDTVVFATDVFVTKCEGEI